MNARYYLPEVGRFISPDTVVPEPEEPQSYNRYAYSLNNPVRYTDPSGHMHFAGEQFGGTAPQAQAGTTAPQPTSLEPPPLPSPIVTTPRVVEQFPLPDSSDLTQWLIDILIAYANSDQINGMAVEWWLSQLLIGTGNNALGRALMGDVLQEWFRHVYPNAVWDFKPDILIKTGLLREGNLIELGGMDDLSFEAVANIFYGFIGRRIGMGEILLQGGAGAAQAIWGFDHWYGNLSEYPFGFGDQAFDAWSIGFGFYLYDQFGSNLIAMTVPSFTSSLASYRALNPMPTLP